MNKPSRTGKGGAMVKKALVLLAVALILAAYEQRAPKPTATVIPAPTRTIEEEWPIPTDRDLQR